ncbi:glycosyltransferase family 2 protein [Kushneria marisflavi]|uniref:Glycosyl transferase n=1 Tax=Kushneria marisflavi TaxID=157779 RepID=A0A240UQS3_9GAMM|nr:glycosyltransferase family 2 protein [Kushneria marisflavi]ART63857.1 glycosyl transferase [Kushneria marisflavi]RKD85562.1 glycosyltransferase involved in cell wall biosynthesis [Kushneria marisflavi]
MNRTPDRAAFTPCVLVPVYNHEHAIVATCEGLADLKLPIVLVDDGSDAACAGVLDRLAQASDVHLLRLPHNRGKGYAVRHGLAHAQTLGFTHALQVDADGQHDRASLPPFIEAARQAPERLLIGYPRFDHSVPLHRFVSRYITHVWVWFNTLSMALRDTMCGVRLYPLAPLNAMLLRHGCGNRMEFDTEVLVRWFWAGHPVDNLPVRVTYPTDGVSHFRLFRDNVLMARMHLRLTLGMLIRVPMLIFRRCRHRREAQHKSSS